MRLRHEVWRNREDTSDEFCIATRRADLLRLEIEPGAELVHVIYASSWDEAMLAYHTWQGWGPYKPIPCLTDIPYSEEWLREQGLADLVRTDEEPPQSP